jgi:hypothetical protein
MLPFSVGRAAIMRSVTEEEIEALARAAAAEIQATVHPDSELHEVSAERLDQEYKEEEHYFHEIAIPLGDGFRQAGILGSNLIAEDRGN